jgi:SNF2 family DNA or RNA helicase
LLKLRQLSVHPQVYIEAQRRTVGSGLYTRSDWTAPSTKFTVVRNMLEQEKKPTKWILFCQFHDEMEILEAYLSKSKTVQRIQQYHGGLSDKEKEEVIRNTHDICEDGHDVLLLQLQSGGVGLNLQHFTRIIFLSPWWTSALMEQAIGRAVRIGQKEQVQVTLLVLKEEDSLNIDQAMLEKAMVKSDLLKRTFQHASRGLEEEEEEEDDDYSSVCSSVSEEPLIKDIMYLLIA